MRCTEHLKMTVAETMKALRGFDPDDEVYVRDPSGGFVSYDPLIIVCRCDLDVMEGFEEFGQCPLLVTSLSAGDEPVADILDEIESRE